MYTMSIKTQGGLVDLMMSFELYTTDLCCHLWFNTRLSVQIADLFHVMDPALQQKAMLLQLVNFIRACPPAFQLIL